MQELVRIICDHAYTTRSYLEGVWLNEGGGKGYNLANAAGSRAQHRGIHEVLPGFLLPIFLLQNNSKVAESLTTAIFPLPQREGLRPDFIIANIAFPPTRASRAALYHYLHVYLFVRVSTFIDTNHLTSQQKINKTRVRRMLHAVRCETRACENSVLPAKEVLAASRAAITPAPVNPAGSAAISAGVSV